MFSFLLSQVIFDSALSTLHSALSSPSVLPGAGCLEASLIAQVIRHVREVVLPSFFSLLAIFATLSFFYSRVISIATAPPSSPSSPAPCPAWPGRRSDSSRRNHSWILTADTCGEDNQERATPSAAAGSCPVTGGGHSCLWHPYPRPGLTLPAGQVRRPSEPPTVSR